LPLPSLFGPIKRPFVWIAPVSTPLPFIVISPSTRHVRTALALNDYSGLRVWERMLGVPCVNAACTAPAMGKPFHL
jgi:hypothetical protein